MTRNHATRRTVVLLVSAGIMGLVPLQTLAQTSVVEPESWGYLFGFGQYPDPGGTLHTVFEIQRGPGVPIRTYTTDIAPDGGQFLMIETIDAPVLGLSEIETGLGGAKGVAAVAGGRYEYKDSPQIDLSPLGALAEHKVDVEPNQTYYLPDGARLVTGGIERIAGVEVIVGTFTHPDYPSQQAFIGASLDSTISALLQFPIYIRIEVDGETQSLIRLIEFSYQPPQGGTP